MLIFHSFQLAYLNHDLRKKQDPFLLLRFYALILLIFKCDSVIKVVPNERDNEELCAINFMTNRTDSQTDVSTYSTLCYLLASMLYFFLYAFLQKRRQCVIFYGDSSGNPNRQGIQRKRQPSEIIVNTEILLRKVNLNEFIKAKSRLKFWSKAVNCEE